MTWGEILIYSLIALVVVGMGIGFGAKLVEVIQDLLA